MKDSNIQQQISKLRLEDEEACVLSLRNEYNKIGCDYKEAAAIAAHYIDKFRESPGQIGMEEFFRQYGLDTDEGVAVMSMAEALLRIPDAETANEFIHDKISSAKWQAQKNKSTSSIVKASNFGLKIASKLMEFGGVTSTVIDPVIRESIKQSMRVLGDHFVMGETIEKAILRSGEFETKGYIFSYDMLGEGARSEEQAEQYFQNYLKGIEEVAASANLLSDLYSRPGISVKLSALYSKYKLLNQGNVYKFLLPRLTEIALRAKYNGICLTIDAEESSRLDISLDLFAQLLSDEALSGFDGIGLAVQAYNKSAVKVIDFIANLARNTNRRIPVRLVKGAYWDSEIKFAQISGISNFPVFTQKEYTDLSYLVCAHKMLQNSDAIYPQFATHNALTIASIQTMAGDKQKYEFQKLYGMGDGIHNQVIGLAPCRIYAPVGPHKELLPYLIRRILENGASTSFLKKVIDTETSIDELIKNPAEFQDSGKSNKVKLPANLYGDNRRNSSGFDLGNASHLESITINLERFKDIKWNATPIINGRESKGEEENIIAPYSADYIVGKVINSAEADIKNALSTAQKAFLSWKNTPIEIRAQIIEKFADLLEQSRFEAIALCIKEAGKTLADSIAELREAVDFCNYYAMRARELFSAPKTLTGPTGEQNELSYSSRGVFVCISPWNFPLAIFTGQIVAALSCGNTVVAKPAEQTPLIAAFAVKLLLKAGLPKGAISLLPGDGAFIGEYLFQSPNLAGVVFTGSNETANIIQMSLAKRGRNIVPFIAETGGINAMIVDSSALVEQAVDDIILSAFGSAGQRCSALRVLYVQEDIADILIHTLKGAMANLSIGSPEDFSTDIGPVIDQDAYNKLNDYISGVLLSTHNQNSKGNFIYPAIIEVASITELPGEIFGPVLHIIRFEAEDLPKIINDINQSGYGLTLGVQSRINSRIKYIRQNANVGNIYINRSMIGATVGVQPFGGEGLSGTGPKAGGPNYLMRFVTERCYTENTAAIGGNRELLK